MKLKLRPSAKAGRRYLLLEASSKESVEKAILDYIGLLGWAKAAPFFVPQNKIILAVNRGEIDKIRAAFALAKIKVLKVSGTINGLELGAKLK